MEKHSLSGDSKNSQEKKNPQVENLGEIQPAKMKNIIKLLHELPGTPSAKSPNRAKYDTYRKIYIYGLIQPDILSIENRSYPEVIRIYGSRFVD